MVGHVLDLGPLVVVREHHGVPRVRELADLPILSLELHAEPHLLRRHQAQRRVVDGEIADACRQTQRRIGRAAAEWMDGQAPEIDGQVYLSGGEATPGTMREPR